MTDRRTFLTTLGGTIGGAVLVSEGLSRIDPRSDADRSLVSDGTPVAEPPDEETPVPTVSSSTPTPPPKGETRHGKTLSGISPRAESSTYFDALEEWLGVRPAVAVVFTDMELSDDQLTWTTDRLEGLWQRGYVPLLFLQPNFGAAAGDDRAVARRVAAGRYDDRLDAWGAALARWAIRSGSEPDRRAYLNLAPEFNGDWVPWGIPTERTTPEDYVGMWRRIRDRVMRTGLRSDHVQWIWTANNSSSGAVDIERCYPGDSYVDWVGVTGYNWVNWGWSTPEELYEPIYRRLRALTDKPLAIAEFGASADCAGGHCPDRKDAWIADVYDYVVANDVRLACWFDHWIEKDETDWGVFDSEVGTERVRIDGRSAWAYGAFREAMHRPEFVHAHPVDARHLTDAEFAGAFAEDEPSG